MLGYAYRRHSDIAKVSESKMPEKKERKRAISKIAQMGQWRKKTNWLMCMPKIFYILGKSIRLVKRQLFQKDYGPFSVMAVQKLI